MPGQGGQGEAGRHVLGDEGDVEARHEEAERHEQTARGDEGDHIGHARHHGALDPAGPGLGGAALLLRRRLGAGLDAARLGIGRGGESLVDQLGAVGDRALDRMLHQRQSGEALPTGDVHVRGDDQGAGRGDLLLGEGGDPAGALGLHVQRDALVLRGVLEGLRGHVGVGDASGAGGDRQQHGRLVGAGRGGGLLRGRRVGRVGGARLRGTARLCGGRRGDAGLLGLRLRSGLGLEHAHDEPGGLLGSARPAQRGEELGTDQGARELGEELQVLIVGARRGGDRDDQVGRAVGGAEVDRLAQAHQRERRLAHGLAAAVRDREAPGHAGGEGLLALQQPRLEAVALGASGLGDEVGHQGDHGVLVPGRGDVEPHQLGGHQRSGHGGSPSNGLTLGGGSGRGQRRTTAEASIRTWSGRGMVVPGRPTAAVP